MAHVNQLYNDKGNPVANHYIVYGDGTIFQSYGSAVLRIDGGKYMTFGRDWDYSKTTWKWLRYFMLNEVSSALLYRCFGTYDVRMEDVRKAIKNGTVMYDENMR